MSASQSSRARRPRTRYIPSDYILNLDFRPERTIDLRAFHLRDTAGETLYSRRIIRSAGWYPLFQPMTHMYPRLVRGFYENLVPPPPSTRRFTTSFDGYTIEVTPAWICQMLDIPDTLPLPPPPAPDEFPTLTPLELTPQGSVPWLQQNAMVQELCGRDFSYVQMSQIPEEYWLLGFLLHQNTWGHGHKQRYNAIFLRAMYNIIHGSFFNLGDVIFNALVACKTQMLGSRKESASELWLGHLVTKLIVRHGVQIEAGEPTCDHLTEVTWETWNIMKAARNKARLAPATSSTGEEAAGAQQQPEAQQGTGAPPEYITRAEYQGQVNLMTSQFGYLACMVETIARKVIGDEEEYEKEHQMAQRAGERRQERLLRTLDPTRATEPPRDPFAASGSGGAGTSGTAHEEEEEEDEEEDDEAEV